MFTNGLKYIIPCQSRFSRQSKKKMIHMAYDTVLTSVKRCLDSNQMSITDERAKQSFSELERIIQDLYRKPLPRRLYRRTQREHKQVKTSSTIFTSATGYYDLPNRQKSRILYWRHCNHGIESTRIYDDNKSLSGNHRWPFSISG